jgi:hypothetical protein
VGDRGSYPQHIKIKLREKCHVLTEYTQNAGRGRLLDYWKIGLQNGFKARMIKRRIIVGAYQDKIEMQYMVLI